MREEGRGPGLLKTLKQETKGELHMESSRHLARGRHTFSLISSR